MKTRNRIPLPPAQLFAAALVIASALAPISSLAQQQVVLDKPVRAGELIVFPGVSDPQTYYYVSDKPRLATDANGQPQFSFLRYVQNTVSGADQPEAREGEGGGIVHAVVALSVTRDQITAAQRELQRLKAGATIVGPVIFKSGRFGLVSSFRDPSGGLTTQVVGLGNAPILDGEKAAVSIQLTKQGAKILWESFQTPTPDISFSFEMQLDGYLSPRRALLEADFDQIYEHQGFAVGIASTYLAGEIRGTFDDLQRSGAIRLTQVGSDERLEALITTAYNKISDMMFSPLNGTGTPSLDSLAGTAGSGPSVLDRATTMLAQGRQDARQENERIRRENRDLEERRARDAENRRQREQARATGPGGTDAPPAEREGPHVAASSRTAGAAGPTQTDLSGLEQVPRESPGSSPQSEVSGPQFAIVAVYEMKRVRQRGTFRIDLNKFTPDTLTLRFDENIGDLRQFIADENYFRMINLDDPFYRQREIVVFLDGLSIQDFGQYVNFANFQLRKRHAGGDLTLEEVRIDRNNFNSAANNFKMVYGWKGDSDRRRWSEYEYRATWSFFGGINIETGWTNALAASIPLVPPCVRQTIEFQGDQETLNAAQVRAVQVRLFQRVGGTEQPKQVTLNPARGPIAERVDLILPRGQTDYDYEITWQLRGNRTLSSGRKTATSSILFVDELPNS